MSNDGIGNTLRVALGVCVVCSIFVSAAAVKLAATQERNKKLDTIKNILLAGDLYAEGQDVETTFRNKIEPIMIDLETGEPLPDNKFEDLTVNNFDLKEVSKDPEYSRPIDDALDGAHVKRIPKYSVIYQVVKDGKVIKRIFPIYGKGLWSTLYGFMALGQDLNTFEGFTFYEHGETPGLGGEVDNPRWKGSWKGKKAFDDMGNIEIEVLKGTVNPNSSDAIHQVDGLSGATITTRGVNNLVRFWLGENGYGPFLTKVKGDGTDERI